MTRRSIAQDVASFIDALYSMYLPSISRCQERQYERRPVTTGIG